MRLCIRCNQLRDKFKSKNFCYECFKVYSKDLMRQKRMDPAFRQQENDKMNLYCQRKGITREELITIIQEKVIRSIENEMSQY